MIREAHNYLLASHDYLHLNLARVRFMRLQLLASGAIILLLVSLAFVTSSPNWSKKNINDYLITDLPGFSSNITFNQYSGYITVDPINNGQLFFWFFESQRSPSTDPIIIWLNGGPGCSSMDGLFVENGPLRLTSDLQIKLNPYSWNQQANIIYVDQPVGTGMSFILNQTGLLSNQSQIDVQFYNFLQQFFSIFESYAGREIYITGESYAGVYIPYISQYILKANGNQQGIPLNLIGVAIGNGWISPKYQYESYSTFTYNAGLLGTQEKLLVDQVYQECMEQIANGTDTMPGNMCDLNWKAPLSLSRSPSQCFNVYDIRIYLDNCNDMNWPNGVGRIRQYLNRKDVRDAIHAQHDPSCFEDCSDAVGNQLYGDNNLASIDVLVGLLNSNIRVLLYNGQFDYICNHLGTEMALDNLNWDYVQEYKQSGRYTWLVDKKIAGYAKSARNLTFLQVNGASHMVPYDVPGPSLDMITRFLNNQNFNDYLPPLNSNVDSGISNHTRASLMNKIKTMIPIL
eukprot:TRINITY_DN3376_c0_g1_i1.p1 TRINITY_DN3376_c0_g1~~TRINITY_DN3376_c0_g1_i1.p1  ORF type:complete len:514 (+),score=23.84 TRINITY_DN3376_c0_g1_i1:103-1644(+)